MLDWIAYASRPGQVEVTKLGGGRTAVFLYNDWIDKKKGLSQTITKQPDPEEEAELKAAAAAAAAAPPAAGSEAPGASQLEAPKVDPPVNYTVRLHTSKLMGAGTDARVHVELQVGWLRLC